MNPIERLKETLSLPVGATDEDVLTAVAALSSEVEYLRTQVAKDNRFVQELMQARRDIAAFAEDLRKIQIQVKQK